jgi:hypothetical protein
VGSDGAVEFKAKPVDRQRFILRHGYLPRVCLSPNSPPLAPTPGGR